MTTTVAILECPVCGHMSPPTAPACPCCRERFPTAMREAQLQLLVLSFLKVTGWRVLHIRPARTAKGWRTPIEGDGVGWPDIFACRGERLLVLELKSDTGRVSPSQQAWLDALAATGKVETMIVRPRDWERFVEVAR